MKFVVESACVADGLAINIPPPECGLSGLAVGAHGALTTGCALLHKDRDKRKIFGSFMGITHGSSSFLLTNLLFGLMSGLFWPFIL